MASSTLRRRNLKTVFSLCKRVKVFFVLTTPEEVEKATIPCNLLDSVVFVAGLW